MFAQVRQLCPPFLRQKGMPVMADVGSAEVMVSCARGCMLGLMVGDALGAAVEGFDRTDIRSLAQKTWGTDLIQDFLPAVPMGTFVAGREPATYRPAMGVDDMNFVPAGPTQNPAVAKQCVRTGMYTDDTNACLAVAASIVACKQIDAVECAKSCARMFNDNEHFRGCPPTAKRVMQATLEGVSPDETGMPPFFPFPGGSFANGGAMRISPVGVACHDVEWGAQELRCAVEAAVRASHRHPEAVDFAVVQARAVQYAMRIQPEQFDAAWLLNDLAERCQAEAMVSVMRATAVALESFKAGSDEFETISGIVELVKRPGSGMGFQIASVHMAPCVLWAACLHYRDPVAALQSAIDLAGDTDTTASMVGAIMGALHGENWCARWAERVENGRHGRDYALGLGEQLVHLGLRPTGHAMVLEG
mmetsp:Transcript_118150/g.229701  ORF Transcript_118150/g.229701 Transcript_118150/m.229701 type:complete len:419 (-) Transcript_118150:222-1478(-)